MKTYNLISDFKMKNIWIKNFNLAVIFVGLQMFSIASFAYSELLPSDMHVTGISGYYANNGDPRGEVNCFYNYNFHTPHKWLKSFNFNTDMGYRFEDDVFRISYDLKSGIPLMSIGGIHHFTSEDGILASGLSIGMNIMFLQLGGRFYGSKDEWSNEFFFCLRVPIFVKNNREPWKFFPLPSENKK